MPCTELLNVGRKDVVIEPMYMVCFKAHSTICNGLVAMLNERAHPQVVKGGKYGTSL